MGRGQAHILDETWTSRDLQRLLCLTGSQEISVVGLA